MSDEAGDIILREVGVQNNNGALGGKIYCWVALRREGDSFFGNSDPFYKEADVPGARSEALGRLLSALSIGLLA